MSHKDFHVNKREGEKLGTNLNSWKLFADQFYKASECIFIQVILDRQKMLQNHLRWQREKSYPDRNYTPTLDNIYFLQIGYSLENMIKGLLLFENPDLVAKRKLDVSIKSHNLSKLAAMLKIELSDDEKELLDFITPHIIWYGKYPIPADALDSIGSSFHQIEKVREFFLSLYKKLSKKMEETGKLKDHLHNYEFKG